MASLQGEHGSEKSPQVCLPTSLPTPVSVSPSMFDFKKENELQMYTMREG